MPSGTGVMARNLLRLHAYTGKKELLETSELLFKKYASAYLANPFGYASHLIALDSYLYHPKEFIVLVPEDKSGHEMANIVLHHFIPNKVILVQNPAHADPVFAPSLLSGRDIKDEQVTAFVCQNFTCSLPVTKVEEFKKLIEQ